MFTWDNSIILLRLTFILLLCPCLYPNPSIAVKIDRCQTFSLGSLAYIHKKLIIWLSFNLLIFVIAKEFLNIFPVIIIRSKHLFKTYFLRGSKILHRACRNIKQPTDSFTFQPLRLPLKIFWLKCFRNSSTHCIGHEKPELS